MRSIRSCERTHIWQSATSRSLQSHAERRPRSDSAIAGAGNSDGYCRTKPTSGASSSSASQRIWAAATPTQFRRQASGEGTPGANLFYKTAAREAVHTCSTYGRGAEVMLHTNRVLDLTPEGRDENGVGFSRIGCATAIATGHGAPTNAERSGDVSEAAVAGRPSNNCAEQKRQWRQGRGRIGVRNAGRRPGQQCAL